jgi:hypothetical protein
MFGSITTIPGYDETNWRRKILGRPMAGIAPFSSWICI